MAIDLLSIKPHKVSTDLSGYITYVYGAGGTGKTTLASQLDRALLLACERGYNALPGVIAQDITSWSEMKQVLRELKKPEVQETFKSIVVDTVDLAADYCEKYICNQAGVEKLGDIPWGGGYKLMKKEFESVFRTIAQMGYALFFISHSKDKLFKREDGTEYNQIIPSLSPSYNEIIRNMSDLQGYAHQTTMGDVFDVMLTLRSMDGSVECKSRFKMIEPEIPFNYEALSNALSTAIAKEAEMTNNEFVTDAPIKAIDNGSKANYKELMAEINKAIAAIQEAAGDTFKMDWAPKLASITNKHLGAGKKVADCTPDQVEQLEVILMDVKDLLENGIDA